MSPISTIQLDHAPTRRDRAARRRRAACGNPARQASRRGHRCASAQPALLGAYRDDRGRRRELVALSGRGGTVLVVDRDAATLRDRLLLAHLAADEPAVNAQLVCRDYLCNRERPRSRRLLPGDLLAGSADEMRGLVEPYGERSVAEERGQVRYRLCRVPGGDGTPELRWVRLCSSSVQALEPVGLRELIGRLERYEPMRAITAAAIGSHRRERTVSVRHLQGEYRWLCSSPMVLNRALRQAVLRATAGGAMTMSEIALRCGVAKRDRRGRRSGESSWVARRVGLMPEGGAEHVTPWIHSDVLALIARDGLRVSPREVEVP